MSATATMIRTRRELSQSEASRLGEEASFWCVTRCFVREILDGVELSFGSEEMGDGEGVMDGRASETYELVNREEGRAKIVRRVEVCGYVVEKRTRKDSKVIFTLDDGSGCVECVVWVQDSDAATGERLEMFGIASAQDGAAALADDIRIGSLARVQGKIRDWQGSRQINANSVQIDLDPNEELLFWLDVVGNELRNGFTDTSHQNSATAKTN